MKKAAVFVALGVTLVVSIAMAMNPATTKFYGPNGSALDRGVEGTIRVCGELRSVETGRDAKDKEATTEAQEYEMRLDCNRNQKVSDDRRWLKLPAVVKNPVSGELSSRKGWATRYQKEAETKRGVGAAPYLCVQALAEADPCVKTNHLVKARAGFYRFTERVVEFLK